MRQHYLRQSIQATRHELGNPQVERSPTLKHEVGRDQWLGLLKNIGWDEFQIFEVPVRKLNQHEHLKEGWKTARSCADGIPAWPVGHNHHRDAAR
jgi:hypothetical protein